MTIEDIKNICKIYDNLRRERDTATIAYNSDDTFYEHILATYKLSQSLLPSNLDEAAKKYTNDSLNNLGAILHVNVSNAFKAGAEWMAGQVVMDSIEGTVCGRVYDHINIRYTDDVGKTLEPRNISHIPVNVNKYKIGDKVVVQIRKKDE